MVRIMFYLLYQRKTLFFTHLTCDAFAGGDEPSTDVDDAGGFEKMEKNERRAFDRNFFLHFVVCFVCWCTVKIKLKTEKFFQSIKI